MSTESNNSSTKFAWLSALSIFLSAFLLFQVQPIISRMILPWFGGGPAVWSTCLLFFQVLLLGGYAYAHYVNRLRTPKWQMATHIALLALAACTLPITPDPTWKPADGTRPTWRILSLLLFNVGLPYFILSSTGPLIQAWFSRVYSGRSPYRLYALSNIGSLGALLSYPFVFEPWLTSNHQGGMWSVGFVIFSILCAGLAILAKRAAAESTDELPAKPATEPKSTDVEFDKPSIEQRLSWLLLPALASMMLLAITAHLCQDVAVIPFFWVVPLSLYLLSFIICFDAAYWYRRRIFSVLLGLSVFWICFVMLDDDIESAVNRAIAKFNSAVPAIEIKYRLSLDGDYLGEFQDFANSLFQMVGLPEKFRLNVSDFASEATAFLAVLFCLCMVCHGELVRSKPPNRYLTEFYLMVSAGGALGGILVALIYPQLFSFYVEMNVGLVLGFMLAVGVLWDDLWQTMVLNRLWKKSVGFLWGFGFLLIVVRAQFNAFDTDAILMKRNFYGVLKVKEYNVGEEDHIRELLNGRILHGSQFLDPQRRRMPITYYDAGSGVGLAVTMLHKQGPLRVAVVGLGTGTMAAYGQEGDYYCFYEINPHVPEIANTQFSYLKDTPANIHIEMGDARISMERQEKQNYDLIALDAFSGDAIPVHLLTKESFKQYFRHLKPLGVIAVHVSNRHLDLTPVVFGLNEHFKTWAVMVKDDRDEGWGTAASEWILVTKNRDLLDTPAIRDAGQDLNPTKKVRLWTDQYSNLFQIME